MNGNDLLNQFARPSPQRRPYPTVAERPQAGMGAGGASSFVDSGGGRPAIPPGLDMLFQRYQGPDAGTIPQGLQRVFGNYDFGTGAAAPGAITAPLASTPTPGQPNFLGIPPTPPWLQRRSQGGLPSQAQVPDWVRAFLQQYLPNSM